MAINGIQKQQAHMMSGSDAFFERAATLIEQARTLVARTIDKTMCVTYFELGRMIIEEEQDGEAKAKYGSKLLTRLSEYLTDKFGRGFSLTNLKNARKFYQAYKNQIGQKSSDQFIVGWSHYIFLSSIDNFDERRFYEIEAARELWSIKKLKREYYSSLYERLALSRDKDRVIDLAREGNTITTPHDILKSPFVLEFLGMDERDIYTETDLESAVITKMQLFLLEMGKGFLFEARQKRFTYDGDSFYVDLVLYNRLLQCYVLIDFKNDDLSHQDLGQMLMYVNYYDRIIKQDYEKPTVGILICKKNKQGIVEMTLPEDANVYASEYKLYLPDKKLLQEKLNEWIEEFDSDEESFKPA